MKVRVYVMLRQGVFDPPGHTIEQALDSLGFSGVTGVRQGKMIEMNLDETDPVTVRAQVADMCEKLLANTVIETYTIDLDPPQAEASYQEKSA